MNQESAGEIGRRIKEQRMRRGMGQTEAAAKMGVSQRAWSDYERGRGLSVPKLLGIAKVLNTSLALLMFGNATPADKDEAVAEVAALFGELDPAQQQTMMTLLRNLVEQNKGRPTTKKKAA